MKALILWVFGVYMLIGFFVSSIFSDKPLYKGELRDKDLSFSERFCGIAVWWPLALLIYFFEKRRKGGAA